MKKLTLLIATCFFLFSCTGNTENEDNSLKENYTLSNLEIQINDIGNLKNKEGQINNQLEKFKIGKTINGKTNHSLSSDKILNKEFINVSGFDDEGNSIAYRQEVITKQMDDSFIITFVANGIGETCTGVNCSYCVIKEGGGCECRIAGDPDKLSYCNHTVTIDPPN